jgi:putative RNA 2'-phosphotransferase
VALGPGGGHNPVVERERLVKVSKRMSRALRHSPERVGLRLDPAGWVPLGSLLTALRLARAEVEAVVAGDDKQRFALRRDEVGVEWIRASQGHSVPVDLGLAPQQPPPVLFHGTGAAALDSIRATGLNRGGRHHVHLSADRETARRVGARRGGRVVVLTVEAGAMARQGHLFFRSDNGVWLTGTVPVAYLREPGDPAG